MSLEIVVHFS